MARWMRIAGLVAIVAAGGLQVVQSRLAIRKGEFLIESITQIQAAEASRPSPTKATYQEFLKGSLAAEAECKRLYAERSTTLETFNNNQTFLLIGSYVCLFAFGLAMLAGSLRQNVPKEDRTPGRGLEHEAMHPPLESSSG